MMVGLVVYVALTPTFMEGGTGRFVIFLKLVLCLFYMLLGSEIVASHMMSLTWGRFFREERNDSHPWLDTLGRGLGLLMGLAMMAAAIQLFWDIKSTR